jgi:hypothetical protein
MSNSILTRVIIAFSLIGMGLGPATAQVRAVDPNSALTATPSVGDKSQVMGEASTKVPADQGAQTATDAAQADLASGGDASLESPAVADTAIADTAVATPASAPTYRKDDVIGAAEGVFGKGAEGLAGIVEKILKEQGQPNAYIAGREASGAFVVGLRYGSGTMTHTVEGTRPVYWTGPSIGFDAGGDATKVFVLVYNLYDSQELYRRYPQAEGRAYFVGGFSATYLRRGNIVMIPVRLGVGVRLGANIGYMKFSEKSKWMPF